MSATLISFSEAARQIGCHHKIVGHLVKAHAIPVYRIPYNARGKGLNPAGLRRLRKAWEVYRKAAETAPL